VVKNAHDVLIQQFETASYRYIGWYTDGSKKDLILIMWNLVGDT